MRTDNNMKGQALIIAAIFIIIILLFLWSVVSIPGIKSGEIQSDVEVHSQIHIMGNALDAAKLYMETALAYSTYQACYDTLRNGGWNTLSGKKVYQSYSLWEPPEQHPTILEFKGSLEGSIKENLGLYRGTKAYTFLSDYYVNLPSYTTVNAYVDEDTEKLSVRAGAESNLNIQKTQESGEYIRLEKYGFLQGEYSIDCYGIYAKGLDVYGLAQAAMKKAWEDLKAPAEVTAATQDELSKKLSDLNQTFVDNAKAALYALSTTGADYDVGVDVMSADIKWSKSSETVTEQGTTARIKYAPEIYVKFEVTNIKDGQEFPVYDGSKVVMSPMTLVFASKFLGT